VFELFGAEQRKFLNYERSVAAANDGGRWTFIAEGEVQSFEETDVYREKTIRDRFTPEMLERYCRAMDISIFDEGFYGPHGLLIETVYPASVMSDSLVMSLAEAQEDIGLKSIGA